MSDIESIVNETISGDSTDACEFVQELIQDKDDPEKAVKILRRKYQITPSKREIHRIYKKYFSTTKITPKLRKWMIKKQMRSNSGVLVVTIVLAPHKFSCKYDCSYCPQETDLEGNPTQPRSYLSNEPAMLRALESNFDVKGQFNSRINSYKLTGNIDTNQSSKIEVIFSGGTWESYPLEYREQVIKELYWAANTVNKNRDLLTLEEETAINETSEYRIIGFTLETRPDNISPTTIKDYRRWGVTRIQIGVQHYDDAILKGMNRKCYTKDTIHAIKLLKQAAFKVVVHLMPDLPNSTPEQDKWMFDEALNNPDLQFDDIKIYPTAVVQTFDNKHIVKSKILDMYNDKKFIPYSEKNLQDLIDVCVYYKTRVHTWVRIQRLVRDIPGTDIAAGYNKISNLRQIIHNQMAKRGQKCYCIRCMEIGDKEHDTKLKPMLSVQKYKASGGIEYYISLEAHNMSFFQKIMYNVMLIYMYLITLFTGYLCYWPGDLESYIGLYGFLRLRIDMNPGGGYIPELRNCVLIREVHVYGTSMGVGSESDGSQHKGYGKLLMATAETIAKASGWNKVAVIAGVGTREYYKNKCGYRLEGTYMVKDI
jgi:ELP3 family radical SAM enzyme/protein acetyltransferase